MALAITGTFGSMSFDEPTIIHKKKLIEAFKKLDCFNDYMEADEPLKFILTPDKISFDRNNQMDRHPVGYGFPNEFEAQGEDYSFVLRFYRTRTGNKNDGFNYTPHQITFSGREFIRNVDEEAELTLFFLLRPECKTSPFSYNDHRCVYLVKDEKKLAKIELKAAQQLAKIKYDILNVYGEDDLRQIALGIEVNKETISASGMTEAEIRTSLSRLLDKYPAKFAKAFYSMEVRIEGIIQVALDNNVIYQSTHSGKVVYKWSKDIENGEIFFSVPFGNSPKPALKLFIVNNFDKIMPKILKGLGAKNYNGALKELVEDLNSNPAVRTVQEVQEKVSVDVKDLSMDDLVKELFENELMARNFGDNTVYFLKKGQLDKALFKIESDDWKAESAKLFKEDSGVLKMARAKVRGIRLSKKPKNK